MNKKIEYKDNKPFIWVNNGLPKLVRRFLIEKVCVECNKKFIAYKDNGKFCSRRCSKLGERNPQWVGGFKKQGGYNIILIDHHYYLEHRFVMEKHLGRKLLKNEIVHHRNGVKDDNRLINLEIIKQYGGKNFHKGVISCPFCNKEFAIK